MKSWQHSGVVRDGVTIIGLSHERRRVSLGARRERAGVALRHHVPEHNRYHDTQLDRLPQRVQS